MLGSGSFGRRVMIALARERLRGKRTLGFSTALLFLDIFFAKRVEPERFERERRVPLGWLFVCGAVGFVINIAAVLFIFVGSWYPVSDSNPTGWELADWNVWMVAFTLVSVLSGIAIYLVSQSARRGKTEGELAAEVAV
jgi:amino acid transporter